MTDTTSKPMTDAELKKAVQAAVSKLRKDGLEPTTRNVYALTGGKHKRVLDMLSDFLADEEAMRKRLEETPPIPEDVQDVFETAWATAWRAADASAAEARQLYSDRIAALERECTDRRDIIAELEERLDATEIARTKLDAALRSALADATDLRQKLISAEERLSGRNEILDLLGDVLPAKTGSAPSKRVTKAAKGRRSSTSDLPFDDAPGPGDGAATKQS